MLPDSHVILPGSYIRLTKLFRRKSIYLRESIYFLVGSFAGYDIFMF